MKRFISIFLLVTIALTLSACGQHKSNSQNNDSSVSISSQVSDSVSATSSDPDSYSEKLPADAFSDMDGSLFSGGIERFFYAGDGKLLVYANNLYLYDTKSGTVLAQYSFDGPRLSQMSCTPLTDGYAIIGYQQTNANTTPGFTASDTSVGGTSCYLFDSSLNLITSFSLDTLPTESAIMAAKVSPDGDHIVFSDMDNLYLYSITDNSMQTILADLLSESSGIGIINAIDFTEQGSRIVFLGDIYGSVALDGSDLICGDSQGYALGDSLISYDKSVWIPEDFTKASGQLLMLDSFCENPNIVNFMQGDTTKDGVYGSEQGKYIATATLMNSGVRVNIYDTSTMDLIVTKEFSDTDSSYFARVPRSICIMDDSRAGTVLCGYDQHTIAFNFSF